jgi:hypothetical protein
MAILAKIRLLNLATIGRHDTDRTQGECNVDAFGGSLKCLVWHLGGATLLNPIGLAIVQAVIVIHNDPLSSLN